VFEHETFQIRGVNRSIANMGVVCQVQFCSKLFSSKFHLTVPFVALLSASSSRLKCKKVYEIRPPPPTSHPQA